MNLHEFQAKHLFADYDIPIPQGYVARSSGEAVEAAGRLGGSVWVVKAQVHAGGRGKAGGVKVLKTKEEVEEFTDSLLGSRLVTHQTDAKGQPIHAVLVEQGLDIARELYLGALVDRASKRVTFMGSAAGGMDIEEVAASTPRRSSPWPSTRPPASRPTRAGRWPLRWASKASRSANWSRS